MKNAECRIDRMYPMPSFFTSRHSIVVGPSERDLGARAQAARDAEDRFDGGRSLAHVIQPQPALSGLHGIEAAAVVGDLHLSVAAPLRLAAVVGGGWRKMKHDADVLRVCVLGNVVQRLLS